MAITFFGWAATPSDNGSSTAQNLTITPPTSMTLGDLVFVKIANRRNVTPVSTFSVANPGGQTWSSLDAHAETTASVMSAQGFWCRYDGTWDASPVFSINHTTNSCTTAVMLVFRPSAGSNTWEIDNAQTASFSTPSGNAAISIASVTRSGASSVAIANWFMADDFVWENLTGAGWANTGESIPAQFRNTGNSDSSMALAWSIGTGATGAVSQTQGSTGSKLTLASIVSFAEIAAVPAPIVTNTTKLQDLQSLTITGTSFGAAIGTNGQVLISPTDDSGDVDAVVQTIVDVEDWSESSIVVDEVDLPAAMTAGVGGFLFIRNDDEEENSDGYVVTVADMVLRVGSGVLADTLKDTDTGADIASESLARMVVLSGVAGSTVLVDEYIDASITSGVLDYADDTHFNVTTEGDEYLVFLEGASANRYGGLTAVCVDRNDD